MGAKDYGHWRALKPSGYQKYERRRQATNTAGDREGFADISSQPLAYPCVIWTGTVPGKSKPTGGDKISVRTKEASLLLPERVEVSRKGERGPYPGMESVPCEFGMV